MNAAIKNKGRATTRLTVDRQIRHSKIMLLGNFSFHRGFLTFCREKSFVFPLVGFFSSHLCA